MSICESCGLPHRTTSPCPVGGSLSLHERAVPLPDGTIVAESFRITRAVHQSAMGTVYQAEDLRRSSGPVALKEFNAAGLPAGDRAEALKWLAREAGLLSVLQHPKLPSLLGSASEGERHFIAMPFLEGETLEERIRRDGPLPEEWVLHMALELTDLLVYLHGQEPAIIHRDLKPANILLRKDGGITVMDLGVARSLQAGLPGTAVGTPGYAAPEQYQALADERSDLYALGATLHRALTGYNPDEEAPFRHPPVRDLNPEVSPATSNLVDHLLQVVPERRPQSAAQVGDMLGRAERDAKGEPVAMSLLALGARLAGALPTRNLVWTIPRLAHAALSACCWASRSSPWPGPAIVRSSGCSPGLHPRPHSSMWRRS